MPASKAGRAASVYLGLTLLQRVVGFLVLPFATRAMTQAEFGSITLMIAAGGLAAVVFGAAAETTVFRAAAVSHWSGRDPAGILLICRRYLFLGAPALGLLLAGVVLLVEWEPMSIPSRAVACEIAAVALNTGVIGFALAFLRARERLGAFAVLSVATILATVVGRWIFVVTWGGGVLGWAAADLLAAVLPYVLAIPLLRLPAASVLAGQVHETLAFTLPLVPHRLAFWSLVSLDRLALGAVASLPVVGVYGLASNLALVSMMVIGEINRAFLVEYAGTTFPAPTTRLERFVHIQAVLALAVPAAACGAVALLAVPVFGTEYGGIREIFALMGVGQLLYGLYLIPSNLLIQGAGYSGINWIGSSAGALVALVGAVAVGGRFGGVAVAACTAFGYLLMLAIVLMLIRWRALEVTWQRCCPRGSSVRLLLGVTVCAGFGAPWLPEPSLYVAGVVSVLAGALACSLAVRTEFVGARREGAVTR